MRECLERWPGDIEAVPCVVDGEHIDARPLERQPPASATIRGTPGRVSDPADEGEVREVSKPDEPYGQNVSSRSANTTIMSENTDLSSTDRSARWSKPQWSGSCWDRRSCRQA